MLETDFSTVLFTHVTISQSVGEAEVPAWYPLNISLTGLAAHALATPGKDDALDAVELMNIAWNYHARTSSPTSSVPTM